MPLQVIGCYVYFLLTWRDFAYAEHFSGLKRTERDRIIQQHGFDYARFAQLTQDHQRWQRLAKSCALRKA